MPTFNDSTKRTPISGCSDEGGTLKRGLWDFSVPAMLGTDFTQHGTDDGDISITDNTLRFDFTSQGSNNSFSGQPGGAYVEVAADLPGGDFDVRCIIGDYTLLDSGSIAYLGVRASVGATPYYGAIMYEPWSERIIVGFAGLKTQITSLGDISKLELRVHFDSVEDDFLFYYRVDAGHGWTLAYTHSTGTSPERAFVGGVSTSANPSDEFVAFDELRFADGVPALMYGVFKVHDAGSEYVDFGPGDGLNTGAASTGTNNTFTEIRYAASSSAPPGALGGWQSMTDFQTIGEVPNRYFAAEIRMTGPVEQITSINIPEYDVDISPPDVPTARKYVSFEGTLYALSWTPAAGTNVVTLYRTTAAEGVQFFASDGVWYDSAGFDLDLYAAKFTTPDAFEFDNGLIPFHGAVDKSVPTEPTYSVQAWDEAGNGSALVELEEGESGAGDPPGEPSIDSVTAGDGQLVVAVTAASETDDIYIEYGVAGEGLTAGADAAARTGSGSATLSGLTNDTRYDVVAYAKSGDLVSTPVAGEGVPYDAADLSYLAEFRKLVRDWMVNLASLSSLTGERVFWGWPIERPDRPFAVLSMSRDPQTANALTSWQGVVNVTLYHPSPDTLDDIEEALLSACGDLAPETKLSGTQCRCHHFGPEAITDDTPVFTVETDSFWVLERTMTFSFGVADAQP